MIFRGIIFFVQVLRRQNILFSKQKKREKCYSLCTSEVLEDSGEFNMGGQCAVCYINWKKKKKKNFLWITPESCFWNYAIIISRTCFISYWEDLGFLWASLHFACGMWEWWQQVCVFVVGSSIQSEWALIRNKQVFCCCHLHLWKGTQCWIKCGDRAQWSLETSIICVLNVNCLWLCVAVSLWYNFLQQEYNRKLLER